MERWEPPKPTISDTPRQRRTRPEREPRDLPEIWLMIGARLGITLFLVIAVMFQRLRDQMHLAVLVLLAALVYLAVQSDQSRTQHLRSQTIVDLIVLLAVVPVLVLTGFVAAQTGELLPAERSALTETSIASFIALSVLIGVCVRLFHHDRPMLAAALLPGWMILVALTFVLHEYRNQTVLGIIAVSYFIGAVAVALGVIVDEPVRRYVSAMFYASTILVGLFLVDPGIGNLGDRVTIIQVVLWGLIGFGMVALLVAPNPAFAPAKMLAGMFEGSRRGRTREGRREEP